jgi:hypothetical protein
MVHNVNIPPYLYLYTQEMKMKWGIWSILGDVYIMDHEVVPCSPKLCDWPLNSSWDHFGLHQGKNYQEDHETWGPQEACFQPYITHCTGPMSFVVWEAKEILLLMGGSLHVKLNTTCGQSLLPYITCHRCFFFLNYDIFYIYITINYNGLGLRVF